MVGKPRAPRWSHRQVPGQEPLDQLALVTNEPEAAKWVEILAECLLHWKSLPQLFLPKNKVSLMFF